MSAGSPGFKDWASASLRRTEMTQFASFISIRASVIVALKRASTGTAAAVRSAPLKGRLVMVSGRAPVTAGRMAVSSRGQLKRGSTGLSWPRNQPANAASRARFTSTAHRHSVGGLGRLAPPWNSSSAVIGVCG